MPGLCVALTLSMNKKDQSESVTGSESTNDLVAFVSGLLLGNNSDVRNWFSMFVKSGQRVSICDTVLKRVLRPDKKKNIPCLG